MTLFDVMPSLWLFSSFLFLIFYLSCDVELSLCAVSSSLFSFAFSLLSFPMYIQCFSFIVICFTVFTLCHIKRKTKRKEKYTFCAVGKVTADGGFAKYHGKIFEVYSRDCYITYPVGEVFTGRKSNDGFVLWANRS